MKNLATLLLTTMFALPAMAADRADEWPTHGHDAGNMRFSPLTQVTPQNVVKLEKAWTFHMRPAYLDTPAANS